MASLVPRRGLACAKETAKAPLCSLPRNALVLMPRTRQGICQGATVLPPRNVPRRHSAPAKGYARAHAKDCICARAKICSCAHAKDCAKAPPCSRLGAVPSRGPRHNLVCA
ncbi:hypothetical protein Syun_029722 [Stephania yunnanensis]|uniref:Uncharacterized protein n=1 Tax=Stephania yunnanensis TaxID=152371 RepID=A0AAP0HGA1_9MAGN